jgi:hypothetical protein
MSPIGNFKASRLAKALRYVRPQDRRFLLDTTGSRSRRMTSRGSDDRLFKYAAERRMTVAKIMVLGEKLRDAGAFDSFGPRSMVEIGWEGAFWQAFKGTGEGPACHTSPALLTFNKHLPHVLAQWAQISRKGAVQERIVDTFGHCVTMPLFVNRIDQALDESFGAKALVESMEMVRDGASAREATRYFQAEMDETYRLLLDFLPDELAAQLGRLVKDTDPPPDYNPLTLVEDAIIARQDDPNHHVIEIYLRVNQSEVPRQTIEQFEMQVQSEMS